MVHHADLTHWWSIQRILSRKWVPDVLYALREGPLRWGALLTEVRALAAEHAQRGSITDDMLSATLDHVVQHGLVTADKDLARFERRAIYQLTSSGRALYAALIPLADWFAVHGAETRTGVTVDAYC